MAVRDSKSVQSVLETETDVNTAYLGVVTLASLLLSGIAELAQRIAGRSAFISVLFGATLAIGAWGYWDWSHQTSKETPAKAYAFLAVLPPLAIGLALFWLRRSERGTLLRIGVASLLGALLASAAPFMALLE